ncbi:putative transcriptional regulator SLK3 isoform X2 [Raphanus sativus]|nr:putative transcriptional regulator SLK3 isoform X2 [Raphanus sativus]
MGENNYHHVDKKTRLEEVEQDYMLQQQQDLQLQAWTRQQNQFLQSISPSQRPPYLPQQQYIQHHEDPTGQDTQLQALFHRQMLIRQQHQQTLQSLSPSQRPYLPQQQYQDLRGQDPQLLLPHQQRLIRQRYQQALQSLSPYQRLQLQQLRRQLQQQRVAQQIPPNVSPFGGGVFVQQKFMMFLHHIKQRPADNSITFWRGFVAEHYSPRVKQRLCFSQYKSAGHMLGMLPPDMWQCNLCGAKSGKGFEATFDVLARLFETKYASGVVDELLSLEGPREFRASSGLMIRYWEFCTRGHEEFLLRRLIAPKVKELLEVAQKCQSTISESGSEGVSQQDLQTNSNMIWGAGRNLARVMEPESLNEQGYPKKYARALQISEVVKSMNDLMDFTVKHKIGPIEGLKRLSEQAETIKLQRQKMQEMEQLGNSGAMMYRWSAQAQMDGLAGNNNNSYNHHYHSSAQAASALTNNNNQTMLMGRLNAMNTGGLEEGFPSQRPTTNSNQSPYWSHQRQNLATGEFLSSPQMQQEQQQHGIPNTLQQTHLPPEDATEIPDDFSDDNFGDN